MTGRLLEPRRRRLALAAMVAAVAIVTLDTTILNVAIPTIRHDLDTNLASLQWVITGYSLTLGALLIIGGRIGDLVGTRRAFVTGALLFAGGSLVASIATSTPELVLGEAVLEGIGVSLLFPASLASLSSVFEGPARAKAFALWGGVAGAAAALGPVLGGWLTSDYSWRWGFRINVVVAPLAALAALGPSPVTTAASVERASTSAARCSSRPDCSWSCSRSPRRPTMDGSQTGGPASPSGQPPSGPGRGPSHLSPRPSRPPRSPLLPSPDWNGGPQRATGIRSSTCGSSPAAPSGAAS